MIFYKLIQILSGIIFTDLSFINYQALLTLFLEQLVLAAGTCRNELHILHPGKEILPGEGFLF